MSEPVPFHIAPPREGRRNLGLTSAIIAGVSIVLVAAVAPPVAVVAILLVGAWWMTRRALNPVLAIILLLPLHNVLKYFADTETATYWKEAVLGFAAIAFFPAVLRGFRISLTSTLGKWVAAWSAFVIVKFALASDHALAAWGVYEYLTYVLFAYLTVGALRDEADLRLVYRVFLISLLAVSVGAVIDFGWDVPFLLNLHAQRGELHWLSEVGGRRRAMFSADSPMALGTFCAVGITWISAHLLSAPRDARARHSDLILERFALVFAMLGLLASVSRGPWAQCMIAVVIVGALHYRRKGLLRPILAVGSGIFLGAAAIAYLWPEAITQVADRLIAGFRWTAAESLVDNYVRLLRWRNAFGIFLEHWASGLGLGTAGSLVASRFELNPIVPESQVLKAGVELGVLGMVGYLGVGIAAIREALLQARNARLGGSDIAVATSTAAVATISALLVYSLVLQVLEAKVTAMLFWLNIAMVLWLRTRAVEIQQQPSTRDSPEQQQGHFGSS